MDQHVPDWIPHSPDATMHLDGKLPAGAHSQSLSEAQSRAFAAMQAGQPFVQYYRSGPSGALVKKNVRLVYVPEENKAEGLGKLYWGERSDSTLSANRCLPLEKISEFYLGAQTAVLKQAFEQQQQTGGAMENDDALFSLLSDTTMLDLEAPSVPALCYWLWGLSALMSSCGRDVTETRDAALEADCMLNSSRDRLNMSTDSSLSEVTGDEMDALRRDALAGEGLVRRTTRKFSVAWGANYVAPPPVPISAGQGAVMHGVNLLDDALSTSMALNHSFSGPSHSSAPSARAMGETAARLQAPLVLMRNSFQSLRAGVASDLSSMSTFVDDSFAELSARAESLVRFQTGLVDSLGAEQRRRKALQNKLIEIQGNIRVFARCRPSSAEELAAGDAGAVEFPAENSLQLGSKCYEFDRVYDQSSTQADVFVDVAPFVQSCVDGYNICLMAYGQTGAGKSYTMQGPPSDPGVNTRALAEVFALISEGNPRKTAGYKYSVTVSVVEIYNETIRDLLHMDQNNRPKLDIRQGADGIHIPDLTSITVNSVAEVNHLMATRATPNRAVASTNMNEHSSRSHCVLFVKVVGTNERNGERTAGKLILIDLAGSERLNKSGAEGQALKEAQAINGSLSALGNVISALQSKAKHVPYRDSKLTYLLTDCLSGQSKCLMFCQLSPARSSAQESQCSLQFATRAKNTDLGQAKKNKTVAAAAGAAAAAVAAEAKKDAAAAAAKRGKDKEKADEAAKAAKAASALAEAKELIATLQAQLKAQERELALTRDRAAQQASANAATLATKEREWRDAQSKALAEASKAQQRAVRAQPPQQAWESEAPKRSARTAARAAPLPSVSDMNDGPDEFSRGEQENGGMASAQRLAVPSAGGKKRKSGEAHLEAGTGPAKKQAPSRIAAPLVASATFNGGVAAGAQTARTRRQQQVTATTSGRPATRNRPATAAAANSSLLSSPGAGMMSPTRAASASRSAIPQLSFSAAPLASLEPQLTEEGWRSHEVALDSSFSMPAAVASMQLEAGPVVAAAAPAATTGTVAAANAAAQAAQAAHALSVTELARRKLEERRLKYKAERAGLKKAAAAAATVATGGWKM